MKNVCLKLIFLVFVSIACLSAQLRAQTQTVFSKNNKYVAVCGFEEKKQFGFNQSRFLIDIYEVSTGTLYRNLQLKWKAKAKFEIGFAKTDQYFYVNNKKECFIWDLSQTKSTPKKVEKASCIAFPDNLDYFVVAQTKNLQFYDFERCTVQKTVKYQSKIAVNSIRFENEDNQIVGFDKNKYIYIWNVSDMRFRSFYGTDIKFNNVDKTFVIISKSANDVYTHFYQVNDNTAEKSYSAQQLLKCKAEKNLFSNQVPDKVNAAKSSLSPSGKYLCIVALNSKGVENLLITKPQLADMFISIELKDAISPCKNNQYTFINDNSILINSTDSLGMLINLDTRTVANDVEYLFKMKKGETPIPKDKQRKTMLVSRNAKYIALQNNNKKKKQYLIKSTLRGEQKRAVDDFDILGFAPDSKHIVLCNANKTIKFDSLNQQINYAKSELEKFYSIDSIEGIVERSDLDAEPPAGYKFLKIRELKQISTAKDTSFIKSYIRAVSVKNNETRIQIQLFDKAGNYYYGASAKEWLSLWCNVYLRSIDDKLIQIKDFKVTENSSLTDTITVSTNNNTANLNNKPQEIFGSATVIVLDHSGSMGDDRAKVLQSAAESYIKTKAPNDANGIVKFDHNVLVECGLTKNKDELLSKIQKNGLRNYGGYTAILDAIDKANTMLASATNYKRKSILLLTDGCENSSLISGNAMLKNAIGNDVNVYTIGFGQNVDEDYLKGISAITEGTFYHIYKTKEFDWIFKDVDRKMRNYYTISFKTNEIGYYTFGLDLCLGGKKIDSLTTTINTAKINLDSVNLRDSRNIVAPLLNPVIYERVKTEKFFKEFEKIEFKNVRFITNKTEMVPGSEQGLDTIADYLIKHKNLKIELMGHTDSIGDNEKNMKLSLERAEIVKQLLIKRGVNAENITTNYFGDKKPLTDNKTEEGRAINRRVEIQIRKNF